MVAPNANSTTYGYDDAGAQASMTTTGSGGVARAAYTLARNRAGQTLTEASTITGDPTNGTTTYTYDPLARLSGFTRLATTTSYGWQETANRSSVQVGAGPAVTTSYDNANRPTSDSGGGSYTSDLDGRLTGRPGQSLEWDSLGRLTRVRVSAGGAILADCTYDPLDRLRTVTRSGVVVRFRYVGLTSALAETVDGAGSVIRSIATDLTGSRLVDWTGSGSNQRFEGTNPHHDVTWTADNTGAVSATLRYDPWGTLTSSTGASLPDFRFQGSWSDSATNLSWVISRWYAPSLGRFVSEDSLLGEPATPDSRHLYAYGEGEPIGSWDPEGRCIITSAYRKLYGSACSAFRTKSFAPRAGLSGRLYIGVFIQAEEVRVGSLILRGDCRQTDCRDRPWSRYPTIDSLHSRAWMKVDFDRGTVAATARPSCSLSVCKDALPIEDNSWSGSWLQVHGTKAPKKAGCDGLYLKISYGFKQSVYDISPSINGAVLARRCTGRAELVVKGDGYPTFEMMYIRRDGTGWVFHANPAGGPQYLADGPGDWTATLRL